MSSTLRADRLLCCAVAYKEANVEETPVPDSFKNVEEAVTVFMNTLWYEAKKTMSESISMPEEAYLHPVDIDTDEPGIVTSKAKTNEVHRRKAPLPKITYQKTLPTNVQVQAPPTISLEEARARSAQNMEKAVKSEQKRASRELKAEKKSLEAIELREEKKKRLKNESPEERAERLAEQRAIREERKLAKEEKANRMPSPKTDNGASDVTRRDEDSEQKDEKNNADIVIHVQELLESEANADQALHTVVPPRQKAKQSKMRFFASPVPYDRHLSALEQATPHPSVVEAVLNAKASSALQIIHGPPGTGKTRYLAWHELPKHMTGRVFACAPTNVGTAHLYAKLIEIEPSAALLLPASRIPTGTPVTSQDPNARVVCSTISGRAGPILDAQKFDVVLVDEAAQCMEAWLWSLLREEVHTIVMVGDIHQLPALVSQDGEKLNYGQSMMQRLLKLNYPSTFLHEQHRMHPDIVAFPNKMFYGGRLTTKHDAHMCDLPAYRVVNVQSECAQIGTSYVNETEAEHVVKIASQLREHYDRVVLISPYRAQTRTLLSMGAEYVHTVDSFQGQEADAIVISMVRNADIGFWSDYRRLNVALTRARHCLRIVGASEDWTGGLQELVVDAKQRNMWMQSDTN